MTNKELETIEQLTEVAIRMAELRAENKTLKEINEKLIQSLKIKDVSGHSFEFWDGFNLACDLLEDLGYAKSSTHPYNISECLKAKMNRLPKNKVRKNNR